MLFFYKRMSIPLQYSEYNNPVQKNIRKNKTYKKRSTKKVQNFLESMNDDTMENFEGASEYPAHPQKPGFARRKSVARRRPRHSSSLRPQFCTRRHAADDRDRARSRPGRTIGTRARLERASPGSKCCDARV